jgi:hypothetical protein
MPTPNDFRRGYFEGLDCETRQVVQIFDRSVGCEFIPDFAFNTSQLARVIALRAWRFAHGPLPFPATFDRAALDAECTARANRAFTANPSRNNFRLSVAVSRCGSYMNCLGQIAWRAWRNVPRQHNAEVAAALGMTRNQIAFHLSKLVKAAEELGFPTYGARHHTKGLPKQPRQPIDTPLVIRLWRQGESVRAIAKAAHATDRAVRRSLKESGFMVNHSVSARRMQKRLKQEDPVAYSLRFRAIAAARYRRIKEMR